MATERGRRQSMVGFVAVVSVLLLIAPTLVGCGEPAVIAAVEPTATAYPLPPTDIPPPPPGPTPAALDFPLPAPTNVELGHTNGEHCVDCHTDEETLRAVAAKAEESQENLSEGEG